MKLQDYITARAPKKVKADIIERWQTRILSRGLQTQGELGAQIYLRDYGKGIAAPKCLMFGKHALDEGFPEFAAGFFKKAAELEGVTLEVSDIGNPNGGLPSPIAQAIEAVRIATVRAADHPGFPTAFQPGKFAPMQPVDALCDRGYYIAQPSYWGQPKKDGNKLVVFATPDVVFYQSRQLKLSSAPDLELDQSLRDAARRLGNFILEGELTYLDVNGGEHRTGSQAATTNGELGQPTVPGEIKYFVFSCIWREGSMLRTYGDMVDEGYFIAMSTRSDVVMPILTAKTWEAKANMAHDQQSQGREGEVWFTPLMPYQPGKHKNDCIVRTLYLTEFEALVTGFTATTAAGHAFGAMEIADLDGRPLGAVGTGFTREEKQKLTNKFAASGPFKVLIRSKGFTETGIAFQARFEGFVE